MENTEKMERCYAKFSSVYIATGRITSQAYEYWKPVADYLKQEADRVQHTDPPTVSRLAVVLANEARELILRAAGSNCSDYENEVLKDVYQFQDALSSKHLDDLNCAYYEKYPHWEDLDKETDSNEA